jgi:hypothetical protein
MQWDIQIFNARVEDPQSYVVVFVKRTFYSSFLTIEAVPLELKALMNVRASP